MVYNMSEVGLLLMFRSTEACQFAFMSGCYCLQDMSGSRWLSKEKGKILTRWRLFRRDGKVLVISVTHLARMIQHLKWWMEECVVLGRNSRRKLGEFWLVSRVCLRGSMVKHTNSCCRWVEATLPWSII